MKILLANPNIKLPIDNKIEKVFIRAGSRWPHSRIKKKGQLPSYLPFPFFLAYTATLLKQSKNEIFVIDAVALDWDKERFLEEVFYLKPDIILLEVTTPTIDYDLQLIKEIKQEINTIVAIAGSHANVYANELLEDRNIDFVIKGEYEMTFKNLVDTLNKNEDITQLKGVVFRKDGKVLNNGDAPLIEPLDLLPPPARELFPINSSPNIYVYWDGFCQFYPAIQMHATRGCPYRCYFCLWPQVMYNGPNYRVFSPKRVVDEMEEIVKKYNAREIYFDDDDFTINRKNVIAICNEIINRKLNVKWSCMGDAINVDEEVISLMAKSGCIGMKFGIESGSKEISRTIGKPIDLDKAKKIAKTLSKYNIKSHATFSIGLIGDTSQTVNETLNYAKELDVDQIQVSISTPIPGTKFFNYVKENGLLKKDFLWSDFDGRIKEVVVHPNLPFDEMERIKKKFFVEWLLSKIKRPNWILRQIKYSFRYLKGQGLFNFLKKALWAIYNEVKS